MHMLSTFYKNLEMNSPIKLNISTLQRYVLFPIPYVSQKRKKWT